ncbi:hypothetical protein B0H63DRAFT_556159 [Podospora didyma]|uniref:Fe2OG dioxygenase domain-containing protein n=1 Tax=Podospora didyma TaxID=330526 RepID=A0AAE0U943_9PEZI|nr:hypothetical protein B0H63DRAFT_556159 [Podospora didyma]
MAALNSTIPTVDLSPFSDPASFSTSDRLQAGRALVLALHNLGFAKISGHGVSLADIEEMLGWSKKLFNLPVSEKMKAPHPPGPMPHRGYSGLGVEKVYSTDDMEGHAPDEDVGEALRKISDFKENYEIGSEYDDQQTNIWLPDDVLPGFRPYMTALYERLAEVGKLVLSAIGTGLELGIDDYSALMQLDSDRHSQLRLLHYPSITKDKLQKELFTRLPAHTDWGSFTMLLQDSRGGLELLDPGAQSFLPAIPEEGTLVLNIGDMLQRFTNDYFQSALHRVSVPDNVVAVPDSGIPERYSIPFFVAPPPSHTVTTLPKFISAETPAKYGPVRFEDYGAMRAKYAYQDRGSHE